MRFFFTGFGFIIDGASLHVGDFARPCVIDQLGKARPSQ